MDVTWQIKPKSCDNIRLFIMTDYMILTLWPQQYKNLIKELSIGYQMGMWLSSGLMINVTWCQSFVYQPYTRSLMDTGENKRWRFSRLLEVWVPIILSCIQLNGWLSESPWCIHRMSDIINAGCFICCLYRNSANPFWLGPKFKC